MAGGAVKVAQLEIHKDHRGCLTVAEKLPWQIKRAYWLHGIDEAATRGGHAHRALHRVMVAVSGGFTVTYRERGWETARLEDATVGLFIPPLTWIELSDFTPKAVCLVLASEEHDEADCIRDFQEFLQLRRAA